jgi:hypothetical protein
MVVEATLLGTVPSPSWTVSGVGLAARPLGAPQNPSWQVSPAWLHWMYWEFAQQG